MAHPDVKELVDAYYAEFNCFSRGMCPLDGRFNTLQMSPMIELTKARIEAQLNELFAPRVQFEIIPAQSQIVNGNVSSVWYTLQIRRAHHRAPVPCARPQSMRRE